MGLKRGESVLVVVVNTDQQVLMMQRDDDPNFWQSVTGTIERDELPVQTAYRELMEETGICLQAKQQQIIDCRTVNQYLIRPEWLYRYPKGTLYNNEYVFLATVPASTHIILTEHTDHVWLPKQAAMNKAWSRTNREAIERFVSEACDTQLASQQ